MKYSTLHENQAASRRVREVKNTAGGLASVTKWK